MLVKTWSKPQFVFSKLSTLKSPKTAKVKETGLKLNLLIYNSK